MTVNVDINVIADMLNKRGWSLSTCESCTGGWIGKVLTDMAGSSSWYSGGLVTYSNVLKQKLANVSEESLARYGAVSEVVAAEMAKGCQLACATDVALSVTGVAGPGGGSDDKPVGMVCFGWSGINSDGSSKVLTQTHYFDGDRSSVREQTIVRALNGLQKFVLNLRNL